MFKRKAKGTTRCMREEEGLPVLGGKRVGTEKGHE